MVRRHFPEDWSISVLDLGCGHGAVLYFAHEASYRDVNGVDRSGEQVAAARALGIEGVTEGDLMEAIAVLPDGSRDVIAFDLIEHFRREELLPLVDQVRRVHEPVIHGLKNAARLVIWKSFCAAFRLFLAAETGDLERPTLSQIFLAVAIK